MYRKHPSPSPGPKWEALQEPEPSSDDELDTEDGIDSVPRSGSARARFNAQRARDGPTKATRDPPQSAPPAFAGTSTNVVGDNYRSQMKRKEFESLFTSKKRARFVQDAPSGQDDAMDLDPDEHAKNKGNQGIGKSEPVQKILRGWGGMRPSQLVSSMTMGMGKKQPVGDSSTSPSTSTNAKPDLPRKISTMRPPLFPPKHPFEAAPAESNRLATRDPPSKLAGLPFDTYKRTKSKTVPVSDAGRSMVPVSPVDKPVDKGKAPVKQTQAPQTMRHPPKTKTIPPDAEIIVISEDDDPPTPSISMAKSKSRPKSIGTLKAPKQALQRSRTTITSGSAPSSATKNLQKTPIEVIEILDSDEEQLPSKTQLFQQNNVGTSSGSRLSELMQECATGSSTRRGRSRPASSSGGDSFEGSDGDVDRMNVDEARNLLQPTSAVPIAGSAHSIASDSDNYPDDLFDIPSSPRASSQELQVTDDTEVNQATRGLIPLPSSSPSSIGFSPKESSPPGPTMSPASLTRPSLSQQPSTSTMSPNFVRKPITPSAGGGASIGSCSSRLGFSSVTASPSLQAPPPAGRHLTQFARKFASSIPQPMSDQDEDSGEEDSSIPSEKEGAAQTKANKGKGREIRQSSSSSSGAESINIHGLRDALAMDSDKLVKQQHVSPIRPRPGGQTLAEAITSAGQLNRTKKKMGRRLQGNAKDVPIDHTSDVERGVKHGLTVDENEQALKAAIGSSRLLVNLLPILKERSGANTGVAAAAAKATEPLASSSQEKKLSLSPPRTQDLRSTVEPAESPKIGKSSPFSTLSPKRNIMTPDTPSQQPPSSLPAEMALTSEPSVGKTISAADPTAQFQREQSTAFGFKSGIAMIGPPNRIPLPKRPSAATIERILAAASDSSGSSQQTPPIGTIGLPAESDVPMVDVTSRKSISPMLANTNATSPSAATVMTPSSILLPLSPSEPDLVSGSVLPAKPFKKLTSPKRSPLAMTETSFVASTLPGDIESSTSSQQTTSMSTIGRSSGGIGHDDASMTVSSTPNSQSPELANVQPAALNGTNEVRTQSPGEQPTLATVTVHPLAATASKSPEPLMTLEVSSSPIIVSTSSSDAAPQDRSLDTLGLPSDDPRDDDEEECQALLQSSSNDMDIVPSHDDVQPSLQDSIVVGHKAQVILDASVASSSALTTFSAITEVLDEHTSVSPPIPEVPTRRSSRRSSRSSTSKGLGTAFGDDFGSFDSVPATRTPTPEDQEPSALSSPGSPKTYGGFLALTWRNFRKDLNNFTPKSYYAQDLPHAFQDHINSMSDYTQRMDGMRDLFKATILENTVEDESDAPPIEILNSVDDQATPPWEFYYTNQMWLGEGVPPPDIKSLVSCTCKGGCNPKSKTCACLLRQKEVVGDPLLEFAYDKNGKLKIPGYPIFECNDLCGCSDECRNRVIQHGRKVSVNIEKTEAKGWGVFAGPKKIPAGTFIGIYSGELLTDAVAHERGVKYNKFGRTYLFDIDFHHLKDGNPRWENSFTVDAYHAGNFTRFLNHSCDPNCRLYACYINEGNIQKPLLAIFSRRDIEPQEEICFNYQGSYPDNDDDDDSDNDDNEIAADPDHGKDIVYVPCRCGANNCTGTMFK